MDYQWSVNLLLSEILNSQVKQQENLQRFRRTKPRIMFLGLRGIDGIQGGIEAHVADLIRHLPYSPDSIEVLARSCYRQTDAIEDDRRPIVRWLPTIKSRSLEALVHSLIGVVYASIRRPSILHIHGIGPSIVVPIARLFGLRVVCTHHGDDYRREKWGFFARTILRLGERFAVRMANACISISPIGAIDLARKYQKKIDYIPNGVGNLQPREPGKILREFDLTPKKYIVNVARIVPEKRQIDLIDAFEAIDMDNVKLVLVGGADHRSHYARQVNDRAASNPRVVVTGILRGSALAEVFCNAGLFALPSAHEGLPIALLEAMFYGLPVLVSDLPVYSAIGLPANFIFPLGDKDELAKGLVAAFDESQQVPDWHTFLSAYTWSDIARETAAVYDRVACEN